ncbi:MAG: hypothetical protein ACOYN3_06355 [Acidimicrobiia bacterium]
MSGATREWVAFDDPKEKGRQWMVDITYLASHYNCIFGCGCKGVLTAPTPELQQGCCSYGAHYSDKADRTRTERAAKRLPAEYWQYRDVGLEKGVSANVGEFGRTRLVNDACIFLNRVGFETGPGCAFHFYAQDSGEHFLELKPEVCWQVPLRREDREEEDGTVTSILTSFDREDWGEGGDDFAWWCTEEPEAFTGREPLYRSSEAEFRAILGDALYEQVATYLDARMASIAPPAKHPAEVRVQLTKRPKTKATKKAKR